MSLINIAGLTPVEDPSYRYKMPRITAKVEGRGNGIKTVLTNIIEISQSLNREAPEITKFFGCEIGSQTTYAADTERAVVNGAHNPPDLQNHLGKYIELFVLCKQCRLPETSYRVKGGVIFQKCAACGSKDPCDMTHKLTTFVLNQYKKAKADKAEKAEKSEKGEKGEKKKKEKKSKEDGKEDEQADNETNENKTEKVSKKDKSESKDKDKKKKKKKETNDEAGNDNDGGGDGDVNDSTLAATNVDDEEESDSKAAGIYISYIYIYIY